MHWLLTLIAQVAPSDGSQWIVTVASGLGSAGVSTGILWKIHQDSEQRHDIRHEEDRKTISQLTSRLFLLADRGMEVGQTASEVVRGDAARAVEQDPRIELALQRLEALLLQRGGT